VREAKAGGSGGMEHKEAVVEAVEMTEGERDAGTGQRGKKGRGGKKEKRGRTEKGKERGMMKGCEVFHI